jgi:hypothetical protein
LGRTWVDNPVFFCVFVLRFDCSIQKREKGEQQP